MLDRRRRAKGYGVVQQDDEDLELGEQETGVVGNDVAGSTDAEASGGTGEDGENVK